MSGFADLDALARLGLKGRFPKKKGGLRQKLWKGAVRDEFKENTFKDAFRDELEKFWNEMEDLYLKDNPVLDRKDWKRHAMPVVVHDDGVPLPGIDEFRIGKLMDRLNSLEKKKNDCSSYEVDTIIQVQVRFDKFPRPSDFSEVQEAMQVQQYNCKIHKLETSGSETTEKQWRPVFACGGARST